MAFVLNSFWSLDAEISRTCLLRIMLKTLKRKIFCLEISWQVDKTQLKSSLHVVMAD